MRIICALLMACVLGGCGATADEREDRLRGAFAALDGQDPRKFETERLTVRALLHRYPNMTREEALVIARNPQLVVQYLGR